jgi:hypothetical protein
VGELAAAYAARPPYPHVHLADFLEDTVARRIVAEFPDSRGGWLHYKHYNEWKLAITSRAEFPPFIGAVVDELNSPEFCAWLSVLTGIPGLLADPMLEGGGMHQTERGGYLNMHADFTMHHYQPRWRRRVNVILFLNEGWKPEWGGAIELWDHDMQRCVVRVPPLLNHALIFTLSEQSWHGYPEPIEPPPGVTRKSLALYYYTPEVDDSYVARATSYRPRPQDGSRVPFIWADNVLLAVYTRLKMRFRMSDSLASRILGKLRRS